MSIMDYKYDVFISYSRKDYVDDENNIIPNNAISAIIETFKKNDITFWFDKDGIYTGQEFASIINEAILASKILLFISSKNSNSKEAEWPKRELFEALIHEKYIIPFKVDNSEYHKVLIPHLGNLDVKNELDELVRSIKNYKKELAEKLRREEEQNQKKVLKQKIKDIYRDFRIQATKQDALRKEIFNLFKRVGIEHQTCPVCEKTVNIDAIYCERCGWTFSALPSPTDEKTSLDSGLLATLRANWKCINQVTDSKAIIDGIENENKKLALQLKKVKDELKKSQETIDTLQQKYSGLTSKQEEDAKVYQQTIDRIKDRLYAQEQENNKLKKKLLKKCEECSQYLERIKDLEQKNEKTITSEKIYRVITRAQDEGYSTGTIYYTDLKYKVNLKKFINILRDEYELEFIQDDFKYCNIVQDLIDVVVKKAKRE